jgi:CDP-glycerol glycerophosphotransferase
MNIYRQVSNWPLSHHKISLLAGKKPRFSIIVVAYNVEQYIVKALKSCIFTDISYELIVIENASTDRTRFLIRRFSHLLEGITIIENSENVGLGLGRNQGLDAARGEYVIFLDGDDFFASQYVLDELDQIILANNPDLIIFNHTKFTLSGSHEANPHTKVLAKHSVAERPIDKAALFVNFGTAWNKCYRRSLVEENTLRFPAGIYEDISWNFICQIRARKVCATDKVLIHYRIRPGSILNTQGYQHVQCVKQYRPIYEMLKRECQDPAYAKAVYRYAAGQLAAVVRASRLRGKAKSVFKMKAAALLRDLRGLTTIKSPDLRENILRYSPAWTTHALLDRRGAILSTFKFLSGLAPTLGRAINRFWGRIKLLIYRRLLTHLPLRTDLVFYESYWGQQVSCNPLYLYREARNRPSLKHHWVVTSEAAPPPDDLTRNTRTTVSRWMSLRHLYHLATAKWLVTNTNFPNFYRKRTGSFVINTQHGTPLKTMGLDIRPHQPRALVWHEFAKRCQNWDYVLSSNDFSSEIWREAMPYNYRIIDSGYPRNDLLASEHSSVRNSVRERIGATSKQKVALYAPTYRGYPFDFAPVLEGIKSELENTPDPSWKVIFRGHHLLPKKGRAPVDHLGVDTMDITELLTACDLLITDYSSVMFDFLLLDRPIVLHIPDYAVYEQHRGLYFDIASLAPGPVSRSMPELQSILASQTFAEQRWRNARSTYRAVFCAFDDGKAAERVVNECFRSI